MCRFLGYLGEPLRLEDLLYSSSNSLIHQASEAMESKTRINADGFGIGWYNHELDPEPAVFKDVTPAWSNANLRSLSGKVASRCVLAHVRAAQRFDPVSRQNCHPFQYGCLLWMHNGDIPNRGRLHRRVTALASDDLVARIAGNTDSELAFVLFLSLLGDSSERGITGEELVRTLVATIHQVVAWYEEDREERPLVLNLCVSNGKSVVAVRFALNEPNVPTLHYSRASCLVYHDGALRMRDIGTGIGCVVVASEKMSDDPQWVTLDNGQLVIVDEELTVEVHALPPAAT
jgi:predicted glutamine amidotransferase